MYVRSGWHHKRLFASTINVMGTHCRASRKRKHCLNVRMIVKSMNDGSQRFHGAAEGAGGGIIGMPEVVPSSNMSKVV